MTSARHDSTTTPRKSTRSGGRPDQRRELTYYPNYYCRPDGRVATSTGHRGWSVDNGEVARIVGREPLLRRRRPVCSSPGLGDAQHPVIAIAAFTLLLLAVGIVIGFASQVLLPAYDSLADLGALEERIGTKAARFDRKWTVFNPTLMQKYAQLDPFFLSLQSTFTLTPGEVLHELRQAQTDDERDAVMHTASIGAPFEGLAAGGTFERPLVRFPAQHGCKGGSGVLAPNDAYVLAEP